MTALVLGTKRFCTYCRVNRPAEGFKDVCDPKTGRKVNSKCAFCQEVKKLPIKERDARGAQVREARRAYQARKLLENIRGRNEKIKADSQ